MTSIKQINETTYLTLMMTEYAIDWKLNSNVAGCCLYIQYTCMPVAIAIAPCSYIVDNKTSSEFIAFRVKILRIHEHVTCSKL